TAFGPCSPPSSRRPDCRSPVAPTRSSATSSASGCWACPKILAWTATPRSTSCGPAHEDGGTMSPLLRTATEAEFTDSVRRFVADRTPVRALRGLIDSGHAYDVDVWRQLSGSLGLSGLIIPAEYGGTGAGWAALGLALGELGAGLVASPLLAGALAAGTLLALDA